MISTELHADLARREDLPCLPAVGMEVLRLLDGKDTDPEEFAEALGRDPALVARFLKHASSKVRGTKHEIANVRHLIMLLGSTATREVCRGFALAEELPRQGAKSGLDLNKFWRRSLASALSARALATRVGMVSHDEAALCGLLVNLGKLILDQGYPDEYARVIAANSGWPTIKEEQEALGFHSAEVAAAVLAEWGLPEFVCQTVAFVHDPDALPEPHTAARRRFVELMHLNTLFEGLLCDDDPEASTIKAFACARVFSLSAHDVEFFLSGLAPAIRDVSKVVSLEIPRDLPAEEILERARKGLPDANPTDQSHLPPEERRAVKPEEEEPLPSFEDRIDEATALPNRVALDEFIALQVDVRMAVARPGCLGLVLMRIDQLDELRSRGDEGDDEAALREVVQCMVARTRRNDMWAHFGNSVLALVLPNTVPLGIKVLTGRLRTAVQRLVVKCGQDEVDLTASFGAAWLTSVESRGDRKALPLRALRLLRQARREGGDRCLRGGVERR